VPTRGSKASPRLLKIITGDLPGAEAPTRARTIKHIVRRALAGVRFVPESGQIPNVSVGPSCAAISGSSRSFPAAGEVSGPGKGRTLADPDGDRMRRREFIGVLGGAAAWPLAAHAQQPKMPVIGLLSSISPDGHPLAAFHRGLSEQGYVENRNVAIEYRFAEGRYDRLLALASELVSQPVAIIAAVGSSPAALAAKSATQKIPIVFFSRR
jgi:hypothetical protein